jgi:hypothetical protein
LSKDVVVSESRAGSRRVIPCAGNDESLHGLGFKRVFDYVPSKVDWFARGMRRAGTTADVPWAGDFPAMRPLVRRTSASATSRNVCGRVLMTFASSSTVKKAPCSAFFAAMRS